MLGLDQRAARAAWTVFLIGFALFLAWTIRGTLLLFTAALLFAYLLSPLVDLVGRLFRRQLSRTISLAIVYLALLAVIGSAGVWVGSQVVDQAVVLVGRLPAAVGRLAEPSTIPLPPWLESRRAELTVVLSEQITAHAQDVLPLLQQAGRGLMAAVGSLPFLILVPILSFFFLKDGEPLLRSLVDRFVSNEHQRAFVGDVMADVHTLLLQFMRAVVILCFLTFAFYLVFFLVAGVPYAVLLATLAASLEFLPFIGPLTAAVVIVLVAIFSGYPHVLWIVVFLLAYRMFQDYVVQPYLMSSGIELHPVLVLFGIMAGEQVGGVAGMFLSIPVLATLRILAHRIEKHHHNLTAP